MKNTTIKISEETSDNLKHLKLKYRYKSMDEIVNDSTKYFIEYNISPRNCSKPIIEQFNMIDKTFRSFFKEYENKLFKPFLNVQSQVNLKILEFIENQNVLEKKSEIKESTFEKKKESSHVFSEMEYEKLKKLITFLEEKIFENVQQEYRGDDVFYLIHTFNFFGLKDLFNEVRWYFKKD